MKKTSATKAKTASPKKESHFPQNHLLPKSKGSEMIGLLQNFTAVNKLGFNIPLAYNFNRNIFDEILTNKQCEGIRIYFGLNQENALCLVIAGLDAQFNDVYLPLRASKGTSQNNAARGGEEEEDEGVGDMGQACPLYPEGTVQLP